MTGPTIFPSLNRYLDSELTAEEFRAAKRYLWRIEDDYSNDKGIRKAARKVIGLLQERYRDKYAQGDAAA
jgi:hypothetical protein